MQQKSSKSEVNFTLTFNAKTNSISFDKVVLCNSFVMPLLWAQLFECSVWSCLRLHGE